MRYVMQFLIIVCFAFLGELLHRLLPLPFPASIYGIVLMFIALESKILEVRHIKEVSTTLIMAMPVMFIPPAVGLIETWANIKESWAEFLIITVLSTFVVIAVSGYATERAIRYMKKK